MARHFVAIEPRIWCLVAAVVETLLIAGPFLGWASVVLMVQKEGLYRHLCPEPMSRGITRRVHCDAEDLRINLVFTITLSVQQFGSLPLGVLTDKMGPRFVVVLHLLSAIGAFLISLGAYLTPQFFVDFFFVGCIIMASPVFAAHSSLYHVAALFPSRHTSVCTLLSAVTGLSCMIGPILFLLWEKQTRSMCVLFLLYGFLLLLTLPISLLQPARPFEKGSECFFDRSALRFVDASSKRDDRSTRREFQYTPLPIKTNKSTSSYTSRDSLGMELKNRVGDSTGVKDENHEEILYSIPNEELEFVDIQYTTHIGKDDNEQSSPSHSVSSASTMDKTPHTANLYGKRRSCPETFCLHPLDLSAGREANSNEDENAPLSYTASSRQVIVRRFSQVHRLSLRDIPGEGRYQRPIQQRRSSSETAMAKFDTLRDSIFSRLFLTQFSFEVLWLYIFSFYLGTVNMQLEQLAPSQAVADIWVQMYSWTTSVGFIVSLGIGLLADWWSFGGAFLISFVICISFVFFSSVPKLSIQIVAFATNAVGEETFNSLAYALTGRTFRSDFFCTLCGIIDVAFGLVNLTINPITTFLVSHKIPFCSFQRVLLCVALTSVGFPLWVLWNDRSTNKQIGKIEEVRESVRNEPSLSTICSVKNDS